ncbi:uncharacterized protein LOC135399714 isoform X1 [Ornithodoros turicata]|uniref:uncharacterized protein LOC135399714 isoform X1 n=1 Tax=Ornithodoros turicata TaxID=34597 RepID=UPI003138BF9E
MVFLVVLVALCLVECNANHDVKAFTKRLTSFDDSTLTKSCKKVFDNCALRLFGIMKVVDLISHKLDEFSEDEWQSFWPGGVLDGAEGDLQLPMESLNESVGCGMCCAGTLRTEDPHKEIPCVKTLLDEGFPDYSRECEMGNIYGEALVCFGGPDVSAFIGDENAKALKSVLKCMEEAVA